MNITISYLRIMLKMHIPSMTPIAPPYFQSSMDAYEYRIDCIKVGDDDDDGDVDMDRLDC